MKVAKDFTKPFEVPQRSIRINVYVNFISTKSLKTLGMGRVKQIESRS